MSKKPRKIEEATVPYAAKKPTEQAAAPISADDAAFKRITDKIFLERKGLLHKLAK